MNPIEQHIQTFGLTFDDTAPERGALAPPDKEQVDPITLEPLGESPSLLHFPLLVDGIENTQTYRIDTIAQDGFKERFTDKLFANFGEYPKTIPFQRDGWFFVLNNIDTPEKELMSRVHLLYTRVGDSERVYVDQVSKIEELLPELHPRLDMLPSYCAENLFRSKDLYIGDCKEVRLSHVYDIKNGNLESGVQKVYHFVLDDVVRIRPEASIEKIVNESEELALNKQIIDFIRPYLWIMEKVHGKDNMDKSPLIKVSRYAMAYAKRTGNYESVRKIMWVATNFIAIVITTLIVAGVIALAVSHISSQYENLSKDGESIFSFLWNWQDRADAGVLRALGWDPDVYYIHRRYEHWGNTTYEYQSVRVR